MTDYAELKQMASASLGEWYVIGELRYEDRRSGDLHGLPNEDSEFIAAADPAAVLALIAENESAHKHWKNESNNVQAMTAEVVRLQAENEALRLALESCADELARAAMSKGEQS